MVADQLRDQEKPEAERDMPDAMYQRLKRLARNYDEDTEFAGMTYTMLFLFNKTNGPALLGALLRELEEIGIRGIQIDALWRATGNWDTFMTKLWDEPFMTKFKAEHPLPEQTPPAEAA